MRLCDRDIERYLAEGKISITPLPDADMISGVSVDIRLGNKFRVFVAHTAAYIDLSGPRAEVDKALNSVMSDEIYIADGDKFILHPGELALAMTIALGLWWSSPVALAARVYTVLDQGQGVEGTDLNERGRVVGNLNVGGLHRAFITGDNGASLPPSYTLFGQVTAGLDTAVAAMAALFNPDPAANGVPPAADIILNSVTISEA